MTDRDGDAPVVRALVVAVLAAITVHVLASVVAGALQAVQTGDAVEDTVYRVGYALTSFGSAGTTADAVALLFAVMIVAWRSAVPAAAAGTLVALLVAVGLLAVARTVGTAILAIEFGDRGAPLTAQYVGLGVGDVLLCAGGLVALRRIAEAAMAGADAVLVFAVDRTDGEVFAARSFRELARVISVYSIEDDEFEFFTAGGRVVTASLVDWRPAFEVTDDVRLDDLLRALRRFATQHELDVAPEARDDPSAYVGPIEHWQALELWPPWLRPIGRLVRAFRGR